MQPRLLKHPARLAGASLLRLQDDQRLVALAREGHDPAFAAIVDRYGRQLERYCARLLGPGRAEDAVQQAFVNAHAAMKASDQELVLKPWLYRIAHNAAMNILRAARDDEETLELDRAGAVMTADVVELRERLRETLAAVQALPAQQRDAILLRELEGRSHEEIAAALGVSEGGARQHLHRARVSLRAAASAITPYPVLARVLSAAADTGRGADLVSGAGLSAGAGALKVAASVLAAGAIAGGAVGVQHHHASDPAARASKDRSTTAPSEANGPSAAPLDIADQLSAGATPGRDRGHGGAGARGHDGRRHGASGNDRLMTPGRRLGGSGDGGRAGSEDNRGSSGGKSGGEDSTKTTSGSSGTSGHDGTSTEASHEDSTTTTSGGSSGSDDGSSTSGSSGTSTGSSGGSGSDGGGSLTTPSTTSTSGGDGISTGSTDLSSSVVTTDH